MERGSLQTATILARWKGCLLSPARTQSKSHSSASTWMTFAWVERSFINAAVRRMLATRHSGEPTGRLMDMVTPYTHGIVGLGLGKIFAGQRVPLLFWGLAAFLPIA